MGYHQAGFEVVGVDIEPQPRYPFRFIRADALEFLAQLIESGEIEEYDLIHTSPPCQAHSVTKHIHKNSAKRKEHPDLVKPTRRLLQAANKPYIIENVPGAPLNGTLMLCGTMFGLNTLRHRIFETYPVIMWPPSTCNHWGKTMSNNARVRNRRVVQSFELAPFITVSGHDYKVSDGKIAMDIDWMTRDELSEAIPPAYTKWIGLQMLEMMKVEAL